MTELATQTAPLTTERRAQVQELLGELVLLSAAATAVRHAALTLEEREKRLAPIVARRAVVEDRLFG